MALMLPGIGDVYTGSEYNRSESQWQRSGRTMVSFGALPCPRLRAGGAVQVAGVHAEALQQARERREARVDVETTGAVHGHRAAAARALGGAARGRPDQLQHSTALRRRGGEMLDHKGLRQNV
jgi:hypothetical protein